MHDSKMHVYVRYHGDVILYCPEPKIGKIIVEDRLQLSSSCYVVKIEESPFVLMTMFNFARPAGGTERTFLANRI